MDGKIAMTDAGHPEYEYATIQEAICDIAFRSPGDHRWGPLTPLEFFNAVKADYPVVDSLFMSTFPAQVGPEGVTPEAIMVPASGWYQSRHATRESLMIRVTTNRLTVHCVGAYAGWASFRADIDYVWRHMRSVTRAESIARIGVRYINRIDRTLGEETLGAWLQESPYIPRAAASTSLNFVSQVQLRLDASNLLKVIVGEIAVPPGAIAPFVFDIDRISEAAISSESGAVLGELDRLHEDVWRVFEQAKGPKLELLLRGESP